MYRAIDKNSPTPLYLQVEQIFEDLILSQTLGTNELLPGVPLLAQQLGVSQFTVQKAYKNLQERGLIYSILGKGTYVAEARQNAFVGLLIHHEMLVQAPQSPTLPILIGFIRDALMAAGLSVRILTDMNRRQDKMSPVSSEVMSTLTNERLLGVISLGHFGSEAFFRLMRQRSIPTVGFHATTSEFDVSIWQSWADLLRLGMKRLVSDGRKRVAVLWLDNFHNPAQPPRKLDGVEAVFSELQLPCDPELIVGVHQATDWAGYHAFNDLWQRADRPDGLIIMDDVIGRGVLMGTLAHQVAVPGELAVVVQSNVESPIAFPGQWHRYEFRLSEMANGAVSALRRLMAGEAVSNKLTFQPSWREAISAGDGPATWQPASVVPGPNELRSELPF